ncbi:guanylate kinase [Rhodococcus sp. MALMAid1271]|uniref:guanylate kinase n=1 Tax=Rhodococcus sp. MALMAid1271 TaxID=3411744 RepID=UPI0030FB272E
MSSDTAAAPVPSTARGRLVVLSGPSGVGKSSVVRLVRAALPDLVFSVSVTTRSPRPGEIDGQDYHFVSAEEFDRMIADGELLEWASIHGGLQRSGTPTAPVDAALDAGSPVLLELDLAGARAVRVSKPEALLVFMAPPTWEDLVSRLVGRATEESAATERRLETARVELAAQDEFDTVVVNTDVDHSCEQLVSLLVGRSSVGTS